MAIKYGMAEGQRLLRDYIGGVANNAEHWYELPVSLARVVRARLKFGVGPRHFSLFELKRVPPSKWDEYLTDVPSFKRFLREQSPSSMHTLANDKASFHRHCQDFGLACPPIVCIVNARDGQSGEIPVAADEGHLRHLLESAPSTLFAKKVDGTFGIGAFDIQRREAHFEFASHSGTPQQLLEYLNSGDRAESAWLIQPKLTNHDDLKPIMSPSGMGTIRIVTCMATGHARILFALLKLTVGTNVTDNFQHGSTGNLVATIDIDRGTLSVARGSARRDWPAMRTFASHPDTGARIEGATVPSWKEVTELVLRAQQSAPALKSAGWDIAVTPDGPLLLEANLTYSTDILQVAYGRGLKSELLGALTA